MKSRIDADTSCLSFTGGYSIEAQSSLASDIEHYVSVDEDGYLILGALNSEEAASLPMGNHTFKLSVNETSYNVEVLETYTF